MAVAAGVEVDRCVQTKTNIQILGKNRFITSLLAHYPDDTDGRQGASAGLGLGDPEIGEPRFAGGVIDEDVVRLDVPMHHLLCVSVV